MLIEFYKIGSEKDSNMEVHIWILRERNPDYITLLFPPLHYLKTCVIRHSRLKGIDYQIIIEISKCCTT